MMRQQNSNGRREDSLSDSQGQWGRQDEIKKRVEESRELREGRSIKEIVKEVNRRTRLASKRY